MLKGNWANSGFLHGGGGGEPNYCGSIIIDLFLTKLIRSFHSESVSSLCDGHLKEVDPRFNHPRLCKCLKNESGQMHCPYIVL